MDFALDHLPGLALNFQSPAGAQGSAVPEWVQLTPKGPRLAGNDGRTWTLPNPEAVVGAFNARGDQVPIDLNHATHIKGPKGEDAPAVGWVQAMEVRDGAIWGRVSWTDHGRQMLATQSYKFLSPAFHFEKAKGEVLRIVSAGLTNTPNLKMVALNNAQGADTPAEQETPMALDAKKITDALKLQDGANTEQVVLAINTVQEKAAATPDPAAFIPVETHQLALNRATAAEAKLAERDKAETETAINAAVDAAIADGKIAPANRAHFLAMCSAEGGLDTFKAFVATAPKVVEGTAALDGKTPGGAVALNATDQELAKALGMTEAEMLEQKKKEEA
ncbi:MAG: phage protease [Pseudomonadota bacterium]